MNNDVVIQEKALINELKKWSNVEDSALKKKSRLLWIKLGDANNSYFNNALKERCKKNKIHSLVDSDGHILTNRKNIQDEFLRFCKLMLGISNGPFMGIDVRAIRQGKQLDISHMMLLSADVSKN